MSSLADIDGLKTLVVLEAPFTYGPNIKGSMRVGSLKWLQPRGSGKARFLKPALLNLCKERYLSSARGVLSVDVDELVYTSDGQSIFEKASNSWLKYVQFKGTWCDSTRTDDLVRHADHDVQRTDLPGCPTKYCICPIGPLKNLSWSIHSLESRWRLPFVNIKSAFYYHFRRITTNWKNGRRLESLGSKN